MGYRDDLPLFVGYEAAAGFAWDAGGGQLGEGVFRVEVQFVLPLQEQVLVVTLKNREIHKQIHRGY